MPKLNKADDRQSTYFASMAVNQGLTSPEENDPELQELANRLGATPESCRRELERIQRLMERSS